MIPFSTVSLQLQGFFREGRVAGVPIKILQLTVGRIFRKKTQIQLKILERRGLVCMYVCMYETLHIPGFGGGDAIG